MKINKSEIKGRLQLWEQALTECCFLLSQSIRAFSAFTSSEISEKENNHIKKVIEFSKTKDDYREGTLVLTHLQEYESIFPRPFPTAIDCLKVSENNIMLASALLSQIFNPGNAEKNYGSKNSLTFNEKHFPVILKRSFSEKKDIDRFNFYTHKMISARDSMIGHADAGAFYIHYEEPFTASNMHSKSIEDIDAKEFLPLLEKVLEQLRLYKQSF
ncbi:hypothetical protein [Parendozoicomonas sp. Alg238-R29]|uniref:hypothetical protein n=1 Tax=Parendozoicomonas sp. Alg238-R29 TaxID=2993446 RepID=UPI00248E5727|nr:hypothetical protein [Parendozoicomonas sp. Alg238-R29]